MIRHAWFLGRLISRMRHAGRKFVAVEVGVASGRTSEYLLQTFPHLLLIMVDPWIGWRVYKGRFKQQETVDEQYREAVARTEFAKERRIVMRMPSEEAARLLQDRRIDLVFLDGSHDYVHVRQDLNIWWPKVRTNGVFCGHDYVEKLPEGKRAARYHVGVKRAVDEFAERKQLKLNLYLRSWMWWIHKIGVPE